MLIEKEITLRDDILLSAQKLFQQYGIKKTTMEDIAKAMGKGKSTLYYYYSNKEEIFDAVIHKEMLEVFRITKESVDNAPTAEQKLKQFACTKIREARKRINLYKIVQGEIQEQNRCVRHLNKEYDELETNLLKSILLFGINKGEFNQLLLSQMEIMPSVIISSFRGVERDIFVENKYDMVDTCIEAMIGFMINGLKNN